MQYKKLLIFLGMCVSALAEDANSWNKLNNSALEIRYQRGKELIDSLGLKGTEKILDIGCTTIGRTTQHCARCLTSGYVLGIDSSQDKIACAQREYQQSKNLAFACVDTAKLTYENEFDIVYSIFYLQWIKEQKLAMQNIYRALKPGGKAFLYIADESELVKKWEKAKQKAFQIYPELLSKYEACVFHRSEGQWIEWAHEAGLVVVKHSALEKTTIFSSVQELKNRLLELKTEPSFSPSERSIFLDVVVSELYKAYGLSIDEPFPFVLGMLAFELSKPE